MSTSTEGYLCVLLAKLTKHCRYSAVRNGEIATIVSIGTDKRTRKPVLGLLDPLMPLEGQTVKYVLIDPLVSMYFTFVCIARPPIAPTGQWEDIATRLTRAMNARRT
jgi:hypothetical protein